MYLTSRLLEEKLKLGWTISDFCDLLQISTEDFEYTINKRFCESYAHEVFSRLKRNIKKKGKRKNSVQVPSQEGDENLVQDKVQQEDDVKVDFDESNSEQEDYQALLESLQNNLSQINEEIRQKEIKHLELVKERRDLRSKLQQEKDFLIKLQNALQEHKTRVLRVTERISSVSADLALINSDIQASRKKMLDIEASIDDLKKIVVFVYDDGSIEAEHHQVSVDSWSEIFDVLSSNDIFEILTLKQTRQLAQLISFVRLLQSESANFEVVFEDSTISTAYEIVMETSA